jgi:hypothetical protein
VPVPQAAHPQAYTEDIPIQGPGWSLLAVPRAGHARAGEDMYTASKARRGRRGLAVAEEVAAGMVMKPVRRGSAPLMADIEAAR